MTSVAERLSPTEVRLLARMARLKRQGTENTDPLIRLLDPDFEDVLWEYEGSQVEPEVPGNLHEKQLEALHAEARHRFLFWGNQAGKSSYGCIDDVLLALGRHPVWSEHHEPPVTIWASALSWELWEKILLPELLTWIPQGRIIDAPPPHRQSSKRTIWVRADNGTVSKIIGRSAEQGADKYQSARVDRIHFDEEHPRSVWDEALPRLVRHGGHTLTTATPLKGLTWLYHAIYQPWKQGRHDDVWCSHAGLADNPAIAEEEVERLRRAYENSPSQLAARLHGKFARPSGLALRMDPKEHLRKTGRDELRDVAVKQAWSLFGGIDFGSWRWAFVLLGADRVQRQTVLEEVFSQRESLEARAEKMTELLRYYQADEFTPIWGDSANQTDITEINLALERIGSPYRVMPVDMGNKARVASVERLNSLLGRGALLFRQELGEYQSWRLGMNAASDGQPMMGSRLLWEIDNWRYPKPAEIRGEERAQKEDPDDHTADGADAIAALRYAVMSWWALTEYELPGPEERFPPGSPSREAARSRRVAREKTGSGKNGANPKGREAPYEIPGMGRIW